MLGDEGYIDMSANQANIFQGFQSHEPTEFDGFSKRPSGYSNATEIHPRKGK